MPDKNNTNKATGNSEAMPDHRVKLITVHGTGAGDESKYGDGWWQLESTFLTNLGQRLELDVNPDSGVVFPFQWEQGPNKEKERRAAGAKLYQTLLHCEASRAEYMVVGHSHGGSVLYHALLESVEHDTPLKNLKGWCTVGTPFLDYRPNRFLFQRLEGLGLAFYTIGAISVFLGLCLLVNLFARGELSRLESLMNALFLFGALILGGLYAYEHFRKSWHTDSQKKKVAEWYSDRWLGLWHPEDEAISALKNIKLVNVPIIKDDFPKHLIAPTQVFVMVIIGASLVWDIWRYDATNLEYFLTGTSESGLMTHLESASLNLDSAIELAYSGDADPALEDQLAATLEELNLVYELAYTTENLELAYTGEELEMADLAAARTQLAAQLAATINQIELTAQLAVGNELADQLEVVSLYLQWAADLATEAEATWEPVTDDYFWAIFFQSMLLFSLIFIGTYVLRFLAWITGKPVSWMLNKIIWTSVRQGAWGDDILKEDVRAIRPFPGEFNKNPGPMPELVASPLRKFSEQNAIQTLINVRRVLGMSDGSVAAPDLRSELSESLKWEELIHTSYFKVPEFVDLLAIGLHQTGVVALKEDFEMTPERAQMSEWCKGKV